MQSDLDCKAKESLEILVTMHLPITVDNEIKARYPQFYINSKQAENKSALKESSAKKHFKT